MASGKGKFVSNVDIDKLRDYLDSKGHKITTLSEQMGYDKSYLSAVLRGKSQIAVPAYKMMCILIGAKEEDFYIDDKPKKAVTENPHTTVINPGISVEQLNAILLQISTMSDTLAKALTEMTKVQNAQTVTLTQLHADFKRFTEYMGVKDTGTDKVVKKDGYISPASLKK